MAIIPSAKYDTSTTGECGIRHYLGSTVINEARCTCEIKRTIAMEKAAFNRKKTLFTRKLDFHFRKKLVKYYSWDIALYGAVTWTLWKVDEKYMENFEVWCWRRIEKIIWFNCVRNEEVLQRVKQESNILQTIK